MLLLDTLHGSTSAYHWKLNIRNDNTVGCCVIHRSAPTVIVCGGAKLYIFSCCLFDEWSIRVTERTGDSLLRELVTHGDSASTLQSIVAA